MDCPHYHYRSGDYYCDICKNCVNEAKHDNYCTDYNGTNYENCDIYKKYTLKSQEVNAKKCKKF